MATTNGFRALDGNGYSVFISNIAGRKVRVSIVRGDEARNCNDGELVFQQIFASWSRVPGEALLDACKAIGAQLPSLD